MVKTGIIGASGYSGLELVRILLKHPEASLEFVSGTERVAGSLYSDLYPILRGETDLKCFLTDVGKVIDSDVELLFLATPNDTSLYMVPEIINNTGKKLIDLSGSFRLKDNALYPEYYGFKNSNMSLIKEAVYGIPELYADLIRKARLVANPGCYPTSVVLPLVPLFKAGIVNTSCRVVVDSKSGVSGAGRKPSDNTHYVETNESMKAYNLHRHRHEPEIKQELEKAAGSVINMTFSPHLVPINRGILSTIYLQVNNGVKMDDILNLWNKAYSRKKFVRILPAGQLPEIKFVANSPYCDIGFSLRGNDLIIVSCIDNLLKGASSQAVQNFNLMCGFREEVGL
jgi:N-acetyl-gamma-glutamyl-phosphate reductase